jgi:diacylglycerol kinase family enzyme
MELSTSTAARPAMRRRLAALATIGCLAGALVVVGFAVAQGEVWRLPVVLVVAAAAVLGLWYAVSQRGVVRVVGGLVAGAGVAAVLVVTLTGKYRGVPLAVAIALIVVSSVPARYALQRDPQAMRAALMSAPLVPPPSHPVLIMNMKSGGGKAERYRLIDECRARGIEPIVLERGDDLLKLATDAIASGADVVGMAGGDGSQALVARVASEHGIPHVCVPAGTRNHFALDLGLDRNDVVGALDAFHDGLERRVDLARVNGRVFVNNACLGLYAKIVQSEAYRDAKVRTAADMLPDMLGPEAKPFDLRFVGPGGTEWPTAHLVLVSNNPYELDHLVGRGTRERMDLGTLGLVAVRIANSAEAVTFIGLEAAGRIRSFRGWLEWDAPLFRIDSGEPIEIGIDGEALLMDPPLQFESLPGALRVRIPRHAPGSSPAAGAVRLTASTLRDLMLTAAGRGVDPR